MEAPVKTVLEKLLSNKVLLPIGIISVILLSISFAYELPYVRKYERALYDPLIPDLPPLIYAVSGIRAVLVDSWGILLAGTMVGLVFPVLSSLLKLLKSK